MARLTRRDARQGALVEGGAFRIVRVSATGNQVEIAGAGSKDPGSKLRGKRYQYRWDGRGYKRGGVYLSNGTGEGGRGATQAEVRRDIDAHLSRSKNATARAQAVKAAETAWAKAGDLTDPAARKRWKDKAASAKLTAELREFKASSRGTAKTRSDAYRKARQLIKDGRAALKARQLGPAKGNAHKAYLWLTRRGALMGEERELIEAHLRRLKDQIADAERTKPRTAGKSSAVTRRSSSGGATVPQKKKSPIWKVGDWAQPQRGIHSNRILEVTKVRRADKVGGILVTVSLSATDTAVFGAEHLTMRKRPKNRRTRAQLRKSAGLAAESSRARAKKAQRASEKKAPDPLATKGPVRYVSWTGTGAQAKRSTVRAAKHGRGWVCTSPNGKGRRFATLEQLRNAYKARSWHRAGSKAAKTPPKAPTTAQSRVKVANYRRKTTVKTYTRTRGRLPKRGTDGRFTRR